MTPDRPLAVTFDFGQTLADLDVEMLARRLAEKDAVVAAEALERAVGPAWVAYNEAVLKGLGGHPWKILMRRMLSEAAAPEASIEELVDWLWSEQPHKNLWRRPVPGMIGIVDELSRAGVPVGVVSNSEGRLADLIADLGWTDHFNTVADSGKLGVEKPGRAIFDWAAERLNVPVERIVHVGDSHAADVEGALGAGLRAIWFRGDRGRAGDPRMVVCADAAEVRAAFVAWGLLRADHAERSLNVR
jgi:putative hydrolase of the HAD superfamily